VIVLGLNAFGHDAAAVLLVDGEPVFAASEERHDRVRHSAAFPRGAIHAALARAGIAPEHVDVVAFPWARHMARARKAWHVLRGLPRTRAFWRESAPDLPDRRAYLSAHRTLPERLRTEGFRARLVRVPHHLAHAASAALVLPGDDGAALTADGMGEWTTAAAWRLAGGRWRRVRHATYPHSAGKAYAAVTQWLGFRPESDEGKTMGLAALGDPDAPRAVVARGVVRPDPRRLLRVDVGAFGYPYGEARLYGERLVARLGPARQPGEPLRPGDADVARGIQDAVERTFLEAARALLAETRAAHLALAGGLFLNCALNGRLARALPAEVLPFPVAGDAGAAWGAAAHAHRRATGRPAAPLRTLALGHEIDAREAATVASGAPVPADLAGEVAGRIAAGRLVGVARGRAELGPRALGQRSLLGRACTVEDRDRMNDRKGRERWRPLAPVVRSGDRRWFDVDRESPWMILTFAATARGRSEAAAAVHADGTARVQTASREGAPFLHAVLDALEARGEPAVVLNTSLNRPGEPIVNTASEALDAARALGLDAIVLGDRLLDLSGAPP
jgi:carbamoyltransferase